MADVADGADVAAFLHRHSPFDSVDQPTLDRVVATARIESYPAGTVILRQLGEPAKFLYVLRSGGVEVLDDDSVVDLLGEGEVFGVFSLLSGLGPNATLRTNEDSTCYLIDHAVAEDVFGTPDGLAFVSSSMRRRLAWTAEARPAAPGEPRQMLRAGSLVGRPPVTCEPHASVADAARLMAEQRVSALLIPQGPSWGILTDRDLRTRVLAEGRSYQTPVSDVMSFPASTVGADSMAGEVLLLMLEGGVHHFPVLDEAGQLLGVVTDTDLMGLGRDSPFALKSAIERAGDEAAVTHAGRRLPEAVCALVDADVDPVNIGHVVGFTIDALTRRLIQLAVLRLGEPPAPWAWLALGSAARHEQALHTDQDHALAFDPGDRPVEEADPYFAELAEAVITGLEAAGIPRCNGDAMASNSALRRTVDGWRNALRSWMSDIGLEGSILTSIVFDYRKVAGPLEVEAALDDVIRTAPRYPQFMRHLSHRALDGRPPTGFFRDLVVAGKGEHAGTLDIKHGGITLISNLARAYCIGAGIAERRTLRRLAAAAESGRIDEDARSSLSEAFRMLWGVRLEHQAACVRKSVAPDDFVDPTSLGPVARQGLKAAFRIIARQQRVLASELGVQLR